MSPVVPNPPGSPGTVTITLAGDATGGATHTLVLDGKSSTYNTGVNETPATAAAAWAVQLATDLGSFYTASAASGVITVSSINGRFVKLWSLDTTDTTQTVTQGGWEKNSAVLWQETLTAAGRPKAFVDGYPLGQAAISPITIYLRVQLRNFSGIGKTARYRLWRWLPGQGWGVDQALGTIDLNATPGDDRVEDYTTLTIRAGRVALELLDDGAGADLVQCALSAWISY